ncbi:hypothetical protein BKA83DRAFT_4406951 [Pisolithus microcarpus]|nr:hypothetical protein BKA83DRAFT_4406951 [Pisolithus microcarpus]
MSVAEALIRILVRLPKLFIAIAKRSSSTVLHLLRYLLSFWNSIIPKQKRKQAPETDLGGNPTSTAHVDGVEDGEKEDANTGGATIVHPRVGGSVLDRAPTLLGFSTPAAGPLGESGVANSSTMQLDSNPPTSNHPPAQNNMDRTYCCRPPLKQSLCTGNSLYSLIYLLMFLDHPGFIQRSLKATQHHHEDHRVTNVDEWKEFWKMFQKDVSNINLLATVLLAGNANFLSITNTRGLSYWPQKLSYVSLVAALGSILMGLAVRNPRIFTAYSPGYFQVMILVLGFPFELFLYSIILFIAALIVHLVINSAMIQIYGAVAIIGLIIVSLIFYWLITEPLDGLQLLPQEFKTCRV